MKTIAFAGLAFVAGTAAAVACDDHVGRCEIEDWRHVSAAGDRLLVEGVTTCDAGRIMLRLYDGEGDGRRFLAATQSVIGGHTFQAVVVDVAEPESLSIKYSIEPQ